MRKSILALGLLLAAAPLVAQQQGKPAWGSFGVDFESMDRGVHPGNDFWRYVNGRWEQNVTIPPDRGALSQVNRLNDVSAAQVRAILDEYLSRRSALAGDDRRVADYYASLMDQAAIDARGAAPLLADLAPIRDASSHAAIAGHMGRLAREWQSPPALGRMPRYFPSPFAVGIGQDDKNPDRYTVFLGQGGLGLPNRDYYLKTDAPSLKTQNAYRAHLATMLQLTGVPGGEAAERAAALYEFERRLAEAHWTLADSRDAEKTYNPRSLAELGAQAPGFDWRAYLAGAGLAERPSIIVGQTSAVAAMAKIF